MKVHIRSRCVFEFEVKRSEVETLMRAAKLHYDGACQRTALRPDLSKLQPGAHRGEIPKRGVLIQWLDAVDFERYADRPEKADIPPPSPDDKTTVAITTDEADLLAKVTEVWTAGQYDAEIYPIIVDWHIRFMRMIEQSNKLFHAWKMEVEL